jgi:hypothetical protein
VLTGTVVGAPVVATATRTRLMARFF